MSKGQDQKVENWKQIKGSTLPYNFDFSKFIAAHGLAADTATAESSDSYVTVGNSSLATGVWSGELTAVNVGCSTITVTVTFDSSDIVRVRKFTVEVTDPDC